jgi:4-carboxymuconolactone decarboxylase
LAQLTDEVLFGEIWPSAELSQRDRSLVVISTLIATGKTAQLTGHLGRALTNGVTPTEASGVLTHLAMYSGWPNAVSALGVYEQVYTARSVDTNVLQQSQPPLPQLPHAAAREATVNERFAYFAPKFARLTSDVVFDDLWRRTDLTVRDRSLVTIAALAAMGDEEQLAQYVGLGMESGLTPEQIAEALTHLGFYGGWPKATKALTAMAQTLESSPVPERPEQAQSLQQASLSRSNEEAASLTITRLGAIVPSPSQSRNFTGSVAVHAAFGAGKGVGGATVSFAPGARTAWHSHPGGQLLIVTEGCGWIQARDGEIERMCAGDVAWTAPDKEHWHGATATTPMSHVSVSEAIEERGVTWLEPVTETEYEDGPAS